MKPKAAAVQAALDQAGLETSVVELPDSTRTAADAARAIGCSRSAIAKSIVFKASSSGRAILIIASGSNRIDEGRISALVGEALEKATADFVREQTGFAIGGVPPCGHVNPLDIYLDRDLFALDEIWAAAGTPNAVFRLRPADLVRLTGGKPADIKSAAD